VQPAVTAAAAPLEDDDAAVFFYATPRYGVQGPFSRTQLRQFQPHLERLNRWTSLHVWRAGQTEAQAVLAPTLLLA
jgi:hypothetical protein